LEAIVSKELETQALEFAKTYYGESWKEPVGSDNIEFAAAFATQVREQTVAECCKAICLYCASPERYAPAEMDKEGFVSHRFAGRDAEAAMCIAGPIRKFAAPPETTEQEER
jgi:hypothetical protein